MNALVVRHNNQAWSVQVDPYHEDDIPSIEVITMHHTEHRSSVVVAERVFAKTMRQTIADYIREQARWCAVQAAHSWVGPELYDHDKEETDVRQEHAPNL